MACPGHAARQSRPCAGAPLARPRPRIIHPRAHLAAKARPHRQQQHRVHRARRAQREHGVGGGVGGQRDAGQHAALPRVRGQRRRLAAVHVDAGGLDVEGELAGACVWRWVGGWGVGCGWGRGTDRVGRCIEGASSLWQSPHTCSAGMHAAGRTRGRQVCDVVFGVDSAQVAVQEGVRHRLVQRLDHGRADGQVRHKHAVKDVDVHPLRA